MASAQTGVERVSPGVLVWLITVAILIVAIVLVGGATRLTGSGLSITEWKPVLGAIPPLNAADWQVAFDKYKQIPEYTEVNAGMSLAEFKGIFWWEWGHRFLGRFIGVVFLIPLLWFWVRGRIPRRLRLPLAGFFVLGGLQGALGWYMVKSGLADRVDVSQYRLAAHLGLAVVIYIGIVWIVLRESGRYRASGTGGKTLTAARFSSVALAALVFLQFLAGAFVAGMRAGLSHNTWPLMGGKFIPDGLDAMSPGWINVFENALTVQFNHRMLAYLIVGWVLIHTWMIFRSADTSGSRTSAGWLAAAIFGQAALGIWTLLAQVPVLLGVAHQAGALFVLTVALVHAHGLWQHNQS